MGVWTPGPGATLGDDVFVGDDIGELAEGLGGNDVLIGNGGSDWLDGGDGDDVLHGGVFDFALHGGAGFDTLNISFTADQYGVVFLNGGGVTGGVLSGAMVILDANIGGFAETEVTGIEAVFVFAAGNLDFGGTDLDDTAAALGFANLQGFGGDDTLIAGLVGGDLNGGDGDDHLIGGVGDDFLIGGAGDDLIEGGDGSDTVSYGRDDDTPASAITINLAAGTASGGDAAGDVLVDVENVFATDFDDALTGDAGRNFLLGRGGDDVLNGGDGDDGLDGGLGADQLDGGDGVDMLHYVVSSAAVQVDLSTNTVSGGDAEGDVISNFEGVIGSSNDDTLTGDGGANRLLGDFGNDTLNGGAGDDLLDGGGLNDVLNGGDGDDVLAGDDGDDAMHGGDGVDTISYESVQFFGLTLSLETGFMSWSDFHSEADTFTSIENVRGTLAGDTLTGDGGVNVLQGIDGNDRLDGRGGDDRLEGGLGNDTLLGEAGEDDLFGGDGNDTMTGGAGADAFDGGLGVDFASYSGLGVTINLANGTATGGDAEGDTFVNVEGFNGTASADSMTGDGLANILSGGGGGDTLAGAGGNDNLTGGAGADVLDGGDGEDTAIFLTAVIASLAAPGLNTGEAAGDTFISIEHLTGSGLADTLTGEGGANRLTGGGGADTLNGEGGDDRLRGGSGNDAINGGAGTDTADHSADPLSAVTVDLLAGTALDGFGGLDTLTSVENVIGSARNDVLMGADGANALDGGAGNDLLDGRGDADVLTGGVGDDTLHGGEGADTMNGGDGVDALDGGAGDDSAIGGAGDDIVFGGDGNDNLFGESTSETELGITGNDQLFGGAGDDFMRGGLGDDYLDGGTGSDRASYFAIPGAVRVDLRIQGSAQDTLAGGFDTLVGVENVAGSEFADVLIGNHLANWMWSHGGADDITGNAGDDTFWIPQGDGAIARGGQGVDVISFRGRVDETGTDTGGVSFTLGSILAQDTGRGLVTALSMEGAEGSEFNDAISGNNQDNLLSGFTGDDTVNGNGGDDLIYGDHAIREVGENPAAYDYDNPAVFVHGDDVLNGGGGEDLIFGNGGDDVIDGGGNADTIVGGLGADSITGGGGDDQFLYASAAESSSASFDTVVNGVWNNGDVFDVPTAVTSFAMFGGGNLDAATFDTDLGAAMSSILVAGRAVLFTASSGSFAGQRFLVVDGDGVAGYTAGSDYVFLMQGSAASLTHLGVDDFL